MTCLSKFTLSKVTLVTAGQQTDLLEDVRWVFYRYQKRIRNSELWWACHLAGLICLVNTDHVKRSNLDWEPDSHSWVAPVREDAGLPESHTQRCRAEWILAVSLLRPLPLIDLHSPITTPGMCQFSCATHSISQCLNELIVYWLWNAEHPVSYYGRFV